MLPFRGHTAESLRLLVTPIRSFAASISCQGSTAQAADQFACWLAALAAAGECIDDIFCADSPLQQLYPDRRLTSQLTALRAPAAALVRSVQQLTTWPHDESHAVIADPLSLAYNIEALLSVYDRGLRRARGVYYTPIEVIDYLLRSVDEILQDQFGLAGGLPEALAAGWPLLDPACGAGLFLQQALHRAAQTNVESPTLLQSLGGREILPTACAAARWLLWRRLGRPSQTESLQTAVSWGSALEPASCDWVDAHRAGDTPLILVGNPPYANFGRRNRNPWIVRLLDDYKQDLSEKKHNLHDDYIKFLRWAQFQIDRAGAGIVAFITNHAYLDALTHRGMRRSLLQSFDHLSFFDLHGGLTKREQSPDGGERDENVFGIRTGVTLTVLVKVGSVRQAQRVAHAELWGSRQKKLERVRQSSWRSTTWQALTMDADQCRFQPPRAAAPREYASAPRLDEIFAEYISGVQTKNDKLLVDFHRSPLLARMAEHGSRRQQAQSYLPGVALLESPSECETAQPYLVAPFDQRWVYYQPRLLGRARWSVMRHMLRDNLGLVFMRQSTNGGIYDHFLVARHLVSDRVFYSGHGAPYLAPLWRYDGDAREANLRSEYLRQLEKRLDATFVIERDDTNAAAFDAQDVLAYIYGRVCSPAYRRNYSTWLKADFARIPWPDNFQEFTRYAQLGAELIQVHAQLPLVGDDGSALAESADHDATWLIERGFPRWELLDGDRGRVLLNHRQHVAVSRGVWERTVGGYPVLSRWLKQRRGRQLNIGEQQYLHALLHALQRTACEDGDISGDTRSACD